MTGQDRMLAVGAGEPQDPSATVTQVLGLVQGLTHAAFDGISSESLRTSLTTLGRVESALAVVQARVVAAVEAGEVARADGAVDTTAWLAGQLNCDRGRAKRITERAGQLADLPRTAEALAAGEISAEHADEIGRASRRRRLGTPEQTETELVEVARTSPPRQLREQVERREQEVDGQTLAREEARQRRLRNVRLKRRRDGMWKIDGELPSHDGEVVAAAFQAFRTFDPPGVPDEERRTSEQRAADALVDMASAALTHGDPGETAGVKPHVSLVVPWETLAAATDDPTVVPGELGWSGPVSSQHVRTLLCDCDLTRIIIGPGSEILDVGRSTRVWPAATRRALVVRDGGCRFPGCDRPPSWCDAHHVIFWGPPHDGPTNLDNGVLLCRRHHRMVHIDGWRLGLDPTDATVTVTTADGGLRRTSAPRGLGSRLSSARRRRPA